MVSRKGPATDWRGMTDVERGHHRMARSGWALQQELGGSVGARAADARRRHPRARLAATSLLGLAGVALFTSVRAQAGPVTLSVSPRQGQPGIEAARDRLRAMRAAGKLEGGGRIVLEPGSYRLSRPLVLDGRDSGLPGTPTVLSARVPGTVRLLGDRPLAGWRPAAKGLFAARVPAAAMADFRFRELFLAGVRQVLARFPNREARSPLTGGMLYVAETAGNERNSFFYKPGEIPSHWWRDCPQAEVNLYPYNCWDHNIIRITGVDAETGLVSLRYPVAGSIQVGNRYFIQNLRGALDAPGEWFCDWQTGRVLFMPLDGRRPPDGQVTVPALENLIEVSGTAEAPVHDLEVRGLALSGARQDAIVLEGAERCSVVACRIGQVGGVGINVGYLRNAARGIGLPWRKAGLVTQPYHSGDRALQFSYPCRACRVAGNEIHDLGGDAVAIRGQGNEVENNHLSRNGLYDMVCATITICGFENRVAHNTIHDAPRDGIFVDGGRNFLEYNDIRRTMLNTADNAAITLRQHSADLAMQARGNTIRYNRITDVAGYGCYPHCTHPGEGYSSPFCGFGIYLDSFISGTVVEGNLVTRCGGPAFFVQFGADNRFENNIVVQGPRPRLQYDSLVYFGTYLYGPQGARYRKECGPNLFRHNLFVDLAPGGPLYRVGHWDAATRSDPQQARFESNVVWRGGHPVSVVMHASETCRSWAEWQARGQDVGSLLADPRFRDAAHDDYRLRPGSPAPALGFKDPSTELARAGVYRSGERATWPVSSHNAASETHRVFKFGPRAQAIVDGFETTEVGSEPRRWQLASEPPAYAVVTNEIAHSGLRCLKISDAAGQKNPWQPHLYLYPAYKQGTIRFQVSLLTSPSQPEEFYIEMRDWAGPLLVGPTFRVDRAGTLWANGKLGNGGTRVCEITPGQWTTVAMEVTLGIQAPARWTLAVTPQGQAIQRYQFPVPDPAFRNITWIGFSANNDGPGVLYLDDLEMGPIGALASLPRQRPAAHAASRPAEPQGPDRLVADWTMNETGLALTDRSGNRLHGSQGGAERASGGFGHCLRLGSSGSASFGDPRALRFGRDDFTLECWIMPETLEIRSETTRRRILQKSAWPAAGWVLDVWRDGRLRLEMTDDGGHDGTSESAPIVQSGRWNHVTVTVDRTSGTTRYYLDGRAVGQAKLPPSFTGSLDVEGAPVLTGEWQPFAGLLAGLRVYRCALAADRIQTLYEQSRSRYTSTRFRPIGGE